MNVEMKIRRYKKRLERLPDNGHARVIRRRLAKLEAMLPEVVEPVKEEVVKPKVEEKKKKKPRRTSEK